MRAKREVSFSFVPCRHVYGAPSLGRQADRERFDGGWLMLTVAAHQCWWTAGYRQVLRTAPRRPVPPVLGRDRGRCPSQLDVHLVMDNYATHKTPLIRKWLAKRPRWHALTQPDVAGCSLSSNHRERRPVAMSMAANSDVVPCLLGNPPHRHEASPAAHPARPYPRMVILTQGSSGQRAQSVKNKMQL